MQILKRDALVHDEEQFPGGGPLVTVPRGTPKASLPADILRQLGDDWWTESNPEGSEE